MQDGKTYFKSCKTPRLTSPNYTRSRLNHHSWRWTRFGVSFLDQAHQFFAEGTTSPWQLIFHPSPEHSRLERRRFQKCSHINGVKTLSHQQVQAAKASRWPFPFPANTDKSIPTHPWDDGNWNSMQQKCWQKFFTGYNDLSTGWE